MSTAMFWLLMTMSVVLGSGCQSLHPFTERAGQRLQSAKDWAQGGLEALQCGRLQQAKGLFARATAQSPNDFRVRANLARTLHQSGETAEAIAQMELAVQQAGGDPTMHVELGQMYLDVQQLAPASREAKAAQHIDHQFAPAWVLTGRIHRARGELDEALADFQRAAGLAPDNLDIQMDIAHTYRQLGEPQKALATLEYLLAEHPIDRQPENALVARSRLLSHMGQNSAAIASLQRAARSQPDSETILIALAETQMQAGELSRARSTLALAREQFSGSARLNRLQQAIDQAGRAGSPRVASLRPTDGVLR